MHTTARHVETITLDTLPQLGDQLTTGALLLVVTDVALHGTNMTGRVVEWARIRAHTPDGRDLVTFDVTAEGVEF